jgi:hypothetical protein
MTNHFRKGARRGREGLVEKGPPAREALTVATPRCLRSSEKAPRPSAKGARIVQQLPTTLWSLSRVALSPRKPQRRRAPDEWSPQIESRSKGHTWPL